MAAIFIRGFLFLKYDAQAELDRDIVDQPGLSEFRRDQNPHRSILHRGDRRQRLGVPRLEVVDDKAGMGDQFPAGGRCRLTYPFSLSPAYN